MHLITQIFSLLVNICEEIRNIEIIYFFLSFHPGMSIRTFCHDGNILYLSCLIKQPLVTYDYWTLKMWLLQLRNWPFNFIIWFAFEYSHVTSDYHIVQCGSRCLFLSFITISEKLTVNNPTWWLTRQLLLSPMLLFNLKFRKQTTVRLKPSLMLVLSRW